VAKAPNQSSVSIGVDVGGTFTDVFLHDRSSGEWIINKVPSTPPTFVEGFIRGIEGALEKTGRRDKTSVSSVTHGTTIATNAIIQHAGARLGLLMTKGFRDILYIGLGWRPRMYDLGMDPVEPLFLAPRKRAMEVTERMDVSGHVVTPLDELQLLEVARTLVVRHEVEAFVVCFLHAYANPDHERRTKEILQREFPGIPVSISSEVLPRRREYQRLVVTGFDAYVKPVVANYLSKVLERMSGIGIDAPLYVMQSHGGVSGARTVVERPVGTVLSGLAAGVIGAAHVAKAAGYENCISLDIGGTSADIALIVGGRALIATDGRFEDYPLNMPMVDVRTIGAGGSSIAYIDGAGGLKVGPKSAGADPGPVCYSRGGSQPTVTDASFALGYLNAETFAGGISLDIPRGLAAIEEKIAKPLGLGTTEAALGIHTILNANMAQTLRLVSIKRGYDPRDLTLVALGGAGPIHAGKLAEDVHISRVLVPPTPGVLSAMGLMLAPIQHDAQSSFVRPANSVKESDLRVVFEGLDAQCAKLMSADRVAKPAIETNYFAEMRYLGQSHELVIDIRFPISTDSVANAVCAFHEKHQRTYGHADESAEVEFVVLRAVQHTKEQNDLLLTGRLSASSDVEPAVRYRDACFTMERGFERTAVYSRDQLPSGFEISGPAIVEQSDTTVLIYPDHTARVDKLGNMIIEVRGGGR